jgi:hypothetical protein
MKPSSYKIVKFDNCSKCKHVFIVQKDDNKYYCNIHLDRPVPCGDWMNGEAFSHNFSTFESQADKWNDWADENSVSELGICKCFVHGDE